MTKYDGNKIKNIYSRFHSKRVRVTLRLSSKRNFVIALLSVLKEDLSKNFENKIKLTQLKQIGLQVINYNTVTNDL